MAVNPVLTIKTFDNSVISVRARSYDDYAEHNIVLNSVLNYWWANNLPPAIKFLELFDSVIKRTVNEVIPHKTLNLKYNVKANNVLENASEIHVKLISISVDKTIFKIDEDSFSLNSLQNIEGDFETKEFITSFDRSIDTPDIVLKKYKEMKQD